MRIKNLKKKQFNKNLNIYSHIHSKYTEKTHKLSKGTKLGKRWQQSDSELAIRKERARGILKRDRER